MSRSSSRRTNRPSSASAAPEHKTAPKRKARLSLCASLVFDADPLRLRIDSGEERVAERRTPAGERASAETSRAFRERRQRQERARGREKAGERRRSRRRDQEDERSDRQKSEQRRSVSVAR